MTLKLLCKMLMHFDLMNACKLSGKHNVRWQNVLAALIPICVQTCVCVHVYLRVRRKTEYES